jgi:hypothetical protein
MYVDNKHMHLVCLEVILFDLKSYEKQKNSTLSEQFQNPIVKLLKQSQNPYFLIELLLL